MIKLNGTKLAAEIEHQLLQNIKTKRIRLDIIQVGNDYASNIYIKRKILVCGRLGIQTKLWRLENTTENKLIKLIEKLNENYQVNGILLQLPLPPEINTTNALKAIVPIKDVDVFNKTTLNLTTKDNRKPMPCVMSAILQLIKKYKIPMNNKKIVVVGKGRTGGGPIINWLTQNNYNVVEIEKSDVVKVEKEIPTADLLITAIGNNKIIDTSLLKKGCAFFDIGISRDMKTKKISGDINYEVARKVAKWGTPVPGGIGPLTIIMLIKNLVTLKEIQDEQSKTNRNL